MSTADSDMKLADYVAGPAGDTRLVGRSVLSVSIAAMEGTMAFFIVLVSAFAYHVLVLDFTPADFDWTLYLSFATVGGALFGAFSAIATSRFLDNGSRRSTLPDSFYGWTAAIALTLLTAFLLGRIGDLSRVSLTSAYVAGVPLVLAVRTRVQALLADRISRGELQYQRVAVIGTRHDVVNFLLKGDLWRQGHQVINTLYLEDAVGADGSVDLSNIRDFARSCVQRQTDSMVIVGSLHDLDAMETLVNEMKRFALNVVYAPATTNATLKFLDVVPIGANNALRFIRKPLSDLSVFTKRASDIVMAIVGLVLLSPLFLLVAILIRLDSPGPVIYRQARRGFNGDTFMIWKFRSMNVMESGSNMKQAKRDDDRFTRIGRFIRATSIDELPQLVNVLFGQMSIVGPRPHAISHDAALGKLLATYAHRQRIKPGITGWAQVNGFRGETSTLESVQGRTMNDLYYIENWSPLLDLWIIMLTVVSVRSHRAAF